MKTKELIKRLQEEDPSGELECCVGNEDIYFIEKLPAFYDGPLQILHRSNDPGYNIVGATIAFNGYKIQLQTLSVKDVIFNAVDGDYNVDIKVDCENDRTQYFINEWYKEAKELKEETDAWYKEYKLKNND
jgi:hypothetical protein